MVKRYSHAAVITASTGSLIERESSEIQIKGQYFPSNRGQQIKRNANGNKFTVRGEFSTKARTVEGAVRIRIDSIGLNAPIIYWQPFQTHSVIYV